MQFLLKIPRDSVARRLIVAPLAVAATVVWTHALAGLLRAVNDLSVAELAPAGLWLTIAGIVTGLGSLFAARSPTGAALGGGGIGLALALVVGALVPAARIPALALAPCGALAAVVSAWLVERLSPDLERFAEQRRWLGIGWLFFAALAVVQVARLGTHTTNPDSAWFVTTRQPFYAEHQCMNAYLHGAELNRLGEPNVYDAAHYPALTRDAQPETGVTGMIVEDPFQYPPPFLVLPRFALALSHDYAALRSAWFGLNLTLCFGVVLALAGWVRGRAGTIAALATPLLGVACPMLHNLQYGQFHFAAIALAIAGMVAFETRRRDGTALGAVLLGSAILSKVFPAVLLVPLVTGRRFREVGATLGFVVLASVLSLPLVGGEAFTAFVTYQMPRLADGSAFAFGEAWPEVAHLVIAGNQGVLGVVDKLSALGVVGSESVLRTVLPTVYGVALLGVAGWVGVRSRVARADQATTWLGLVGLASLTSTGAWTDYVPVTAVWLGAYLMPRITRGGWLGVACASSLALQVTLFGTVPMGDWADASWMTPLSLVSALSLFFVFGVGLVPRGAVTASADVVAPFEARFAPAQR